MLIRILLSICCVVCCTQNAFSFTRKTEGNKIYYNGNVFETQSADTTMVYNGNINNKLEQRVIRHAPEVIKLNGVSIHKYDANDSKSNNIIDNSTNILYTYLFDSAATLLKQLNPDFYDLFLFCLIVDEKGRLVYYEDHSNDTMLVNLTTNKYDKVPQGFLSRPAGNSKMNTTLKIAIDKKIQELLDNAPMVGILYQDGKAVPYKLYAAGRFEVKDHQVVRHSYSEVY